MFESFFFLNIHHGVTSIDIMFASSKKKGCFVSNALIFVCGAKIKSAEERESAREREWDWVCKWMSHQSAVCDSGAVKLTAPPLWQKNKK